MQKDKARRRAMSRLLTAAAVFVTAVMTSVLVGATDSSASSVRREGTIAFLRFPPGALGHDAGGPSLFTIEANGTHLRRLTPRGWRVYSYEWSPEGNRIAYIGERGSLWTVRRNGSARQLLVGRSRLRCLGLSWSPDGTALAVVAQDPADVRRPPTQHLYIVPTGQGELVRLPAVHVGFDTVWSPRGDEIAYDTGAGAIVVVRADGTNQRFMVGGGGPRWSPDGKSLVFGVSRYASIDVQDADGSNRHRLTDHAYNEYGEAWSPVERRILYGRENREGIYVIDADGRHDRRVTRDSPIPVGWEALAWSPGGRSIAYDTDRTGGGDIYLIDADGRNRVRLTSSADVDVAPSWAPR
jgi:Tol biopolymer transport system component